MARVSIAPLWAGGTSSAIVAIDLELHFAIDHDDRDDSGIPISIERSASGYHPRHVVLQLAPLDRHIGIH